MEKASQNQKKLHNSVFTSKEKANEIARISRSLSSRENHSVGFEQNRQFAKKIAL